MTGQLKSALDVADTGKDTNAQSFADGLILNDVDEWKGKTTEDIFGTTQKAFNNCTDKNIRGFRYDADGLGAGVRGDARVINDLRKEDGLPKLEVSAFHGSGGVIQKDDWFIEPEGDMGGVTNGQYFSNYKAQSWWHLGERFRKTHEFVANGTVYPVDELISIDPNCSQLEKIKTELCQPRRKPGSLKMTVDKAPDDTASPNLADSIMMLYAPAEPQSKGFFDMEW
jgi:hypothetical protein